MPTASLRAPEGYHLVKIMQSCNDIQPNLFEKFGGHPGAAGFTLPEANLYSAKKLMLDQVKPLEQQPTKFNQKINTPKRLEHLTYKKNIIWLDIKSLTSDLLHQVFSLDPFGQDFALPSFGFELNPKNILNYSRMGNKQQHLKVEVADFKILIFNFDDEIWQWLQNSNQLPNQNIWLIAKPNKNSFRQVTSVDLIVEKLYLESI
jgi:single-stranded-DNA-specific exonuclease